MGSSGVQIRIWIRQLWAGGPSPAPQVCTNPDSSWATVKSFYDDRKKQCNRWPLPTLPAECRRSALCRGPLVSDVVCAALVSCLSVSTRSPYLARFPLTGRRMASPFFVLAQGAEDSRIAAAGVRVPVQRLTIRYYSPPSGKSCLTRSRRSRLPERGEPRSPSLPFAR